MGATASSMQYQSPAYAQHNQKGYNPFREFEQNRQKEKAEGPKKPVKDQDPSQTSLLQEWILENDSHLNDVIHGSDKDQINIKNQDFINLLQASTGPVNAPPLNFFISSATFEGEASTESSSFRVRFQVTLLKPKWTSVPLFTESVALVSSHVTYQADYTVPNLATQDPFAIIQLEPEVQADKPLKLDDPIPDEVTTTAYTLGIYKRCYCLIASQPGTYTVDMKVLIPFATSRKTGFLVAIPRAAQNQITFKVPEKDILIKIDPCLFASQSSDANKSTVTARFPPADSLSVQWTENNLTSEVKAELDVKVETSATVEQKCLISIGEGILAIYNQIDYKIVSGQMSLFEVEINKRIKIINVEGQKDIPVKRWEIVDKKKKKKSEGKEEEGKPMKHPILKVWLEYGIEQSYQFTIIAELEMQSTSCRVNIPSFNCMVNSDVTRDRGFLAVEARTNVEVAEIATSALDTADVSEIPDGIYSMAENPILFGYKYLVPQFTLELDVKKHADVGVLIAVIEGAHFTAVCAEEGSVMQRLILRVNNTQKQYVRISVAKEVEIWSTMVNGSAVKPAMDKSGLVMIPLEKASKSSNESSTSSLVEFVYLQRGEPMGLQGTLNFTFPSCDIPINQLFVSVFVPHGFKYFEFFGIKEVSYFSGTPPQAYVSYDNNNNNNIYQDDFGQERAKRRNVNYKAKQKKEVRKEQVQSASAWGGGQRHGVVPVQVAFTTTGREFYFERLLVTEKELTLKVDYKKENKGKTRKLGCCS